MATNWLEVTPKLEQGVKIMDQLEQSKFRILVNRICQALQSSVDPKVFNEEEEEKLLVSLKLTKDELTIMLDTITTIYKQAACCVIKPSSLEEFMKDNFKLEEDKICIFAVAWVTHGKGVVENFKKYSIFPAKLEDINWSLNVRLSSSFVHSVEAAVMLQMCITRSKLVNYVTEFSPKQLADLHEYLEKIQSQLDVLK